MKTPHPENLRAHLATAEKRGALATFYPKLISGIRKGAPVALRWETFDTNHRTISVSKQATKDEAGNLVVTGPKTENSIRQIFISQEAVDLLVREHAKRPDNSWLFPFSQTRAMYHPDSVATLHQRILKDAGLGHSTFTTCTIPLPPWPSRTTWTSRPYPPCWALRRRVHTVSLHPHHPPKAGRGRPGHGQSHGAGAVRNAVRAKKITQRTRREAGLPCRCAAFFSPMRVTMWSWQKIRHQRPPVLVLIPRGRGKSSAPRFYINELFCQTGKSFSWSSLHVPATLYHNAC